MRIKTLGACVLLLLLSTILVVSGAPASPVPQAKQAAQFRLAIVGLAHGHVWRHLTAFTKNSGIEVVGIADPKPELRELAAKDWPNVTFEGTPENINVTNMEKPLGKPRPAFLAPADVVNVAKGKKVTTSAGEPIMGALAMITDGDNQMDEGSQIELAPGKQYVTIDLGAMQEIHAVLFWHDYVPRAYLADVVQVADDEEFTKNVRTLFNNDQDNKNGLGAGKNLNYVETYEGKLVDAKGSIARYVRVYSNGNSANQLNHYIEVEVFGPSTK